MNGHVFSTEAFATIQEAIDKAAPGSTVWVHPGVYTENLTLHKNLTLNGIIDESGARPRINPPSGTGLLVTEGVDYEVSGFLFSDSEVGIRGTAYGMYVSNSSVVIHSNIFSNIHRVGNGFQAYDTTLGGEAIYVGGLVDVYNNIFFNNSGGVGTVALRSDRGTHRFYNNTVTGNPTHSPFQFGQRGSATIWMAGPRMFVFNNIIANDAKATGLHLWDPYGRWMQLAQIEHNLLFNNAGGNTTGVPVSHIIEADPTFIDTGTNDFRLDLGSIAIDAGKNGGAPDGDIDGQRRPLDGNGDGVRHTDIGAYESAAFRTGRR